MNRLTRKLKSCFLIDLRTCEPMEYEQIEDSNACVDKLGKLEDIEEELGIDLITLFKAYSNGFYVKGEKEKQYIDFQNALNANAFKNKEMFYGHEYCYQYVKLYDYGKDWALTKKELEQWQQKND